jgi:hypothetical protein
VAKPDRDVTHMVNIADVYQLFGEIAGIDVHGSVPRTIDSVAMLPYLTNPKQTSIRTWNFTQIAPNLQADGAINGPCVLGNSCSHIPVSKSVCEDNGGVWWGEGATDPSTAGIPAEGLTHCCDVNVWLASETPPQPTVAIQPQQSLAIRNDRYKLVQNFTKNYDAATNACVDTQTNEFYKINEAVPIPRLDKENAELAPGSFTKVQQANYDALYAQLQAILASQPECPGDGNIDGVVNAQDIADWRSLRALSQGKSSWYDINLDGLTDSVDLAIIRQNLGTTCKN